MKGILLIVVTLVTYACSENVGNGTSIYGTKAIQIQCKTEFQHDAIKLFLRKPGYDFLKFLSNTIEPIDVLVTKKKFPAFQKVLKEKNITHEVVHEDMGKVIDEELIVLERRRREANDAHFPSYSQIVRLLDEYAKYRADKTLVFEAGTSFEGRKILGIKLSWGGEDKPCVIIDAGIHARDWISTTAALTIINELTRKTENVHMYKDVDIYIFPLMNPDGYEYSRQSAQTRLWKKTRSIRPGSACVGVDINRNFANEWNTAGTSADPCTDNYAGPYPLSEPEAEALTDFMSIHKNIRAYLSLHSYGNHLLYPYAHTYKNVKNLAKLKCVTDQVERSIYSVRKNIYVIDKYSSSLGLAGGTSTDWAIAKAGVDFSYTMFLSNQRFQFTPPPEEMVPVGLEAFKAVEALLLYAEGRFCKSLR